MPAMVAFWLEIAVDRQVLRAFLPGKDLKVIHWPTSSVRCLSIAKKFVASINGVYPNSRLRQIHSDLCNFCLMILLIWIIICEREGAKKH